MIRRFAAALIVPLLLAVHARADDAPYDCRWTDAPLTIDGAADEPAWKSAPLIDNFQLAWLQGDARTPHTRTKARLLWDRDYLYFYAEMDDADLYANSTAHQGPLWEGDVFELFFKPAKDKPAYYEFEVNPANATLELYLPSRDSGGWVKYAALTHIDFKTAVKLRGSLNKFDDKDQGWSVEGRIPWRDLAPTGGRPAPGEQWTFTLCRVDTNPDEKKTPHLSASAPLTKPEYHRYEDYAPIRFVGPERADATPRPKWTTSKVVGSPDGPLPYTVAKSFPSLKVYQPIYLLEEPATSNCLLLQHLGSWSGPSRLLRFRNDPAADAADTLLDLDGLAYGMTLHPDFARNGYLYVLLNSPTNGATKTDQIVRYTVARDGPRRIDPRSALVILEWESNGHNGGDLAFGPDGYLYHAAGDGTSDSDQNLRGQDLSHLTCAMLRLDVDHPADGKNYSVPKDNPFINTPGARPEIWAYGFRNPWRIAFDRQTGHLWAGQNGQDLWEQVYFVRRGENYGWSVYEGAHPFRLNRQRGPTPISPPAVEHPHSEMRSLTGGVVYRGNKLPELKGAYIYGDWSTGRIWGVKHDGQKVTWHRELARTTLQITGFRESADGDLWVIDEGTGIYRLELAPPPKTTEKFPTRLSDTGLFLSTRDNKPDPALIPYDVNAPLWSDGASKERYIALPGDGTIEMTPVHGWNFPEGTVIVKTFSLNDPLNEFTQRRVETRLLTKQLGQWVGYTYRWADDQSDATLVKSAGDDVIYPTFDRLGNPRQQTWHFPSRAECMTCHSRAANFVLGLSTAQLNKDHAYPDGPAENQLVHLEHLGILKADYSAHSRELARQHHVDAGLDGDALATALRPYETAGQRPAPGASNLLPASPASLPRLADPYDPRADLTARARAYLHSNCAICHVKEGGGNALLDVDLNMPLAKTHLFDSPQHDAFGLKDAKLISPGSPATSVLLHRMSLRAPGQMPPLASSRVDEAALTMLREWVSTMNQNHSLPASP